MWRMTHLYKIRDKNKNLILLKPNIIQQQIIRSLADQNPIRSYYLKYRQGGVSTWWLIWWLDEAISNFNTITGVLSHSRESLKYLWEIIRIAFDNMPDSCRPHFDKYNETEINFDELNSKIFVSLSIRSTAVHNLHISEICFIDPVDLKASLATVGQQGNITIESTANGLGNDGYTMYQDAKAGINGYRSYFFPWWIQPEYRIPLNGMSISKSPEETKLPIDAEQTLWRRITKQNQKELFYQEFPEDDQTAFLSTGNPYFDNKKVMALLTEARDLEKTDRPALESYDYTQWETPNKYCTYVAGGDVAEGIDGDYSVLKVICVTCRKDALRFRARVAVDEFYKICDMWGRKYGNALMAIERNNHGHAVIMGLEDICHYPNLYMQEQETRIVKDRGFRERKDIVKIGWDTNAITKPLMLDHLKIGIEGDSNEDVDHFQTEFQIRDTVFLQECLTLAQDGIKIGATQGNHDDDVIATAIAFQMYLKTKGRLKNSNGSGIFLGDTYKAIGIV